MPAVRLQEHKPRSRPPGSTALSFSADGSRLAIASWSKTVQLTAQGRSRREMVRLQAAEMFAHDADAREIARELRVSTKSVCQWRRAWRAGGEAALASRGAGGNPCKLDEDQVARLRAALKAGPGAYGWTQDQRWTLARVSDLIGRLFSVGYTLRGVSYLLHRTGFPRRAPSADDPAKPGSPTTIGPDPGLSSS